jgi:hypothetical protein
MDPDIHHGHGAWTWTLKMGMDISMAMDNDHQWTGAFGSNYARGLNYVYIDTVSP